MMRKQAVISISVLLLISMIVIPAVNTSQKSTEPKEGSPFDQEPLWKMNVSEEQVYIPIIEGEQFLVIEENSLYFIEGEGEIRWSREFNESIYHRNIRNQRTIEGYIMTLKEGEDMELTLHRIDLDDGSSLWEKSIQTDPYTTRYIVSENNSVYVISDELIMKISEEGEELWQMERELGVTSPYYTRIDSDGNLIGVTGGFGNEDNKILCISSEGELRWEMDIDEPESYIMIKSDFDGENLYLLNNQTLYKLDAEEEISWSQDFGDLKDVKNFFVFDESFYFLTSPDDQNITLSEISKDGEEQWNTTVKTEYNGTYFNPWMTVGNNKRIYFGNYNITDRIISLENAYAFDLDGTFVWEHQFEKNLSPMPQISESGKIYVSTTEGDVYVFQDQALEEERDPHLLLDYWWVLVIVIIAVTLLSIAGSIKKGGNEEQDVYIDEEKPTVGEERYEHSPHEWDDGSSSESDNFGRGHDEGQLEPDLESEMDDEW